MTTDARNLVISFSGGETSARLVLWCKENAHRWRSIIVVFANTSCEDDRTLDFVHRCDVDLGFQTVWIEAVQHHGQRKGPTFKVVTYQTAARDGSVFEEAIRKYGIPNTKFKHCTRALKRIPIHAYVGSLGWRRGDYETAIGIRADEMDRCRVDREIDLIYPLAFMAPHTKPQINSFWRAMPFRLGMKGYQGNCRWCWKKTDRKHYTLMMESPEIYDFPAAMEAKHGLIGPEFSKTGPNAPAPGYHRVFFRGSRSTEDMRTTHATLPASFIPASDDATVYDESLDRGGGCEESCEIYGDDDADLEEEEFTT